MNPRKPYIKTGQYFIRVMNHKDKKLMEISSPFNRVDTHKIAHCLISKNSLLGSPEGSDYTLVQDMLNMLPEGGENEFMTGYALFLHIKDVLKGEVIDNVKCGLVTMDTKLDSWNPKNRS